MVPSFPHALGWPDASSPQEESRRVPVRWPDRGTRHCGCGSRGPASRSVPRGRAMAAVGPHGETTVSGSPAGARRRHRSLFGHHLPLGIEAVLAGRDHLWTLCRIALRAIRGPVHAAFHLLFVAGLAYALVDRVRGRARRGARPRGHPRRPRDPLRLSALRFRAASCLPTARHPRACGERRRGGAELPEASHPPPKPARRNPVRT
jgi:hypothetical protein